MKRNCLSVLVLSILLLSCQQSSNEGNKTNAQITEAKSPDTDLKLGTVDFQVSGSEKAIPAFQKGLLLLHSFEYFDSKNAFQEAQKLDPDFGMAYWGELMTYNQGLWNKQFYNLAQETLLRMGKSPKARLAKLKTPLEQDLFKGIELLFGQGTKESRDKAYRNHMARLYKKYPANHEVATFYAVSILSAANSTKNEALYNQCAAILQKVLQENPSHPGALHYFIHSRDYPSSAHLAIDAAEKYSVIAPDAAHALHMPSHIYIALGRWNDVVNANIDSWNASVKKQKANTNKPASYHALNWLQYAFLQRGEKDKAQALVTKMQSYVASNPNQEARVYLVAMKGAQMIETNTWDGELAQIATQVEDTNISTKAGFFYLEGMKGFHHKSEKYLTSIIDKIKSDTYLASLNVGEGRQVMCNATGLGARPTEQKDVDMAKIMQKQLEAALAKLKGNNKQYLAILKEATLIEENMDRVFGPPVVFKPIHEQYAEALAEQKMYKAALTAYDKALAKNPLRLLSLKGKLSAAKQLMAADLVASLEKDIATCLSTQERKAIL